MEVTSGERLIDDVGDFGNEERTTFFQKPDKNRIRVILLVRTA